MTVECQDCMDTGVTHVWRGDERRWRAVRMCRTCGKAGGITGGHLADVNRALAEVNTALEAVENMMDELMVGLLQRGLLPDGEEPPDEQPEQHPAIRAALAWQDGRYSPAQFVSRLKELFTEDGA
jgi:hypothetical protein